MRIYWDQILVDTSGGRLPTVDDYARASQRRLCAGEGSQRRTAPTVKSLSVRTTRRFRPQSSWKALPGRYTREGDVLPLLTRTDDMFVVAQPGDEIAVSFAAAAAPAPRPGWKRTFLLYANGFSKEMNIRSATPDSLGPLPFHAMTTIPVRRRRALSCRPGVSGLPGSLQHAGGRASAPVDRRSRDANEPW